MKKTKYLKKIIIAIIIILLIKSVGYNLYKRFLAGKVAESAFYNYLNSKNIDKKEINELTIYYDSKGGNGYFIKVIYNNELNLRYEYFYNISKNELSHSGIFDKNGLDIDTYFKEIIPLYEEKGINTLLKYTFFDYLKDRKTHI